MEHVQRIVAEVRQELRKWHDWADANTVAAETMDRPYEGRLAELEARQEKLIAVQGGLINALLWSLGEPVLADDPASWAGMAHGMSYGAIAHRERTTERVTWEVHT